MKHLIAVALVSLAAFVAAPAALADAPSPKSLTGTAVTNADGSRTLTVSGTFAWEKGGKCKESGYAIAWNDPTAPGNLVANGVAVGTPSDNAIHPVSTCVVPTGTFGPLSHTYPASVKSALQACVVTYHNKDAKKTAGGSTRQTDNSIEENEDNLPMVCFTFSPPPPPPPPPTDVCPNIEGAQTSIPAGLSKDAAGNCVPPALVPSPPVTVEKVVERVVVKTVVKKVKVKAKAKKCTCKAKKAKVKVKGVQKKITPRVLPHTR
jgi:hypothetical protein